MRVLWLLLILAFSYAYAEDIATESSDFDFYFDFNGGGNWIPEHDEDYMSVSLDLKFGGMNDNWRIYVGINDYLTFDAIPGNGFYRNLLGEINIPVGFDYYFPISNTTDFFCWCFWRSIIWRYI